MSENKNNQVVVAFFVDEEIADVAVDGLKKWDSANEQIKLGAIGILTADAEGKIKVNVGHDTGKGAGIGAIVGVIAGVLTGGVGLVAGALVGGVFGGALGSFFKKSTHLTPDEMQKIGEELKAGKAAVIVTCDDFELTATKAQLMRLGGTVWSYLVSADALSAAAEAADLAALTSAQDVNTRALDDVVETGARKADSAIDIAGQVGRSVN